MRTSGVLMPISSLPSEYGIGTMGKEAKRFVDFLAKGGQRYWQILPICPTSYGDSPYQSFSSFAGNPSFIDLELLCEEGLLRKEECDAITWCEREDSVDYPIYGKACGEAVMSGKADLGVVVCGTGIGISIAANKVKGIRCGLCTSVEMARLAKQHNNANVLALGGRTTEMDLAMEIVDTWLDTAFEGGRHQRRTGLLDQM